MRKNNNNNEATIYIDIYLSMGRVATSVVFGVANNNAVAVQVLQCTTFRALLIAEAIMVLSEPSA